MEIALLIFSSDFITVKKMQTGRDGRKSMQLPRFKWVDRFFIPFSYVPQSDDAMQQHDTFENRQKSA